MQSQKAKATPESVEQINLFRWAGYMAGRYPDIKFMFHVPNGGKRDATTAARLKMEGVKAGVPDIELPSARGGYFGLFIEMKIKGNKPTENQKEWLSALQARGYYVAVCYGWEPASKLVEEYLSLKPTETFKEHYSLALSALTVCASDSTPCEECPLYKPCKQDQVNITEIFNKAINFESGRFGENVES
ncbi:MAG: hypothetical protein A2Y17_12215 [Clostridiales bacterium GWF2_38_85]|nr:MAG: hypothetical protein A2Y17_12215 [Clostridiales bacterium GWF2_38_85]